jgi:hypothetical protein
MQLHCFTQFHALVNNFGTAANMRRDTVSLYHTLYQRIKKLLKLPIVSLGYWKNMGTRLITKVRK